MTKKQTVEPVAVPSPEREVILSVRHLKQYFKLGGTGSFKYNKAVHDVSFDVYRGENIPAGKKQYALNFVLQDPERTLTDAEVEKAMDRILEGFKNEFGAILR